MDLVQTTTSLIQTLPPAGHGLANAVINHLQEQKMADFSWTGILGNPRLYIAAGGVWTVNWVLTWFSKNVPPPLATDPLWKKFMYAVLVKVADITANIPVPRFGSAPAQTPVIGNPGGKP